MRVVPELENLKESAAIKAYGMLEQKLLLYRMGKKRLGDLPPELESVFDELWDEVKILRLAEKMLEVSNWEELLASA